jgi:hypothetical protein
MTKLTKTEQKILDQLQNKQTISIASCDKREWDAYLKLKDKGLVKVVEREDSYYEKNHGQGQRRWVEKIRFTFVSIELIDEIKPEIVEDIKPETIDIAWNVVSMGILSMSYNEARKLGKSLGIRANRAMIYIHNDIEKLWDGHKEEIYNAVQSIVSARPAWHM